MYVCVQWVRAWQNNRNHTTGIRYHHHHSEVLNSWRRCCSTNTCNYLSDLTELDGTAFLTMDGSFSRGRFALMPSTTFGNRNWCAIGGKIWHKTGRHIWLKCSNRMFNQNTSKFNKWHVVSEYLCIHVLPVAEWGWVYILLIKLQGLTCTTSTANPARDECSHHFLWGLRPISGSWKCRYVCTHS